MDIPSLSVRAGVAGRGINHNFREFDGSITGMRWNCKYRATGTVCL